MTPVRLEPADLWSRVTEPLRSHFCFVMRETSCCLCQTFNSASRYIDGLLNIDNAFFEKMVGQIYPTELQFDKAKKLQR